MLIRPQQKLRDKLFYNNIIFIVIVFCITCFITSIMLQNEGVKKQVVNNVREGQMFGPITVTNKPKIYKVTANFRGNNSSTYISGEVLDKDKDTLYEFSKDLWHESGYDSEGYWSESERNMVTYLTFSEKGTYYIQFNTDEKNMRDISITFKPVNGSYVPHLQVGFLFLLIAAIAFCLLNQRWLQEKCVIINEKLEEMSDD